MEALVIGLFIVGIALMGVGLAFLHLTWTTLVEVRRAMNALHQELAQRRVPREDGR